MAEGEKGEGKGFKVEDRRRFSETGKPRGTQESAPSTEAQERAGEEPRDRVKDTDEELPEISFSTFIISLSTQALMHLGEIPNPLSGKVESDIPVAKQMIDIIGMLREKARGNLDMGEEKLIDDVLYNLRMRYVESVRKK